MIDMMKNFFRRIYYRAYLKRHNVFLHKSTTFKGKIIFAIDDSSDVKIGDGFFCEGGVLEKPCSKFVAQKNSCLEIGRNCFVFNSVIWCADQITIGDGVKILSDCMIMDTDFHSLDWRIRMTPEDCKKRKTKPIKIGNEVTIESGCIIGKGIEIGDNCLIKANSVVTKNVPNDEIWEGNPAVRVK